MTHISRLQYITTTPQLAESACRAGIRWIQLRLKDVSDEDYLAVGREVQSVCRAYGATFILNDRPDLALALGADGVHVGKEDRLPPDAVATLLNRQNIIGCTGNEFADIRHLQGKPVSYIGYGPFRFTTTKQKLSPILGIQGYLDLFQKIQTENISVPPIIAIGGITVADVPQLMRSGIHGIAVSGAISLAGNPEEMAAAFVHALKHFENSFSEFFHN